MTIFGALWSDLTLEHVAAYLDLADDEPLLWEAKGTKLDPNEVRRQVCAFANSHEGGYLILGAKRAVDPATAAGPRWRLEGVAFPDEPITWVTNVIADVEKGVRPRPSFDVKPWDAPQGHVAVVRVDSTSTPPCLANGTVYERLPGKTQTVRDPLRLAELFSRGDEARRAAQARADRVALSVMQRGLESDAGRFRSAWQSGDDSEDPNEASESVRFSVGVAATGYPPNISGRLFRAEFAEDLWTHLRDRPTGLPAGFGSAPDAVVWSQDALTWRHVVVGPLASVRIVRADWDGAAAVGERLATEDVYPDHFAHARAAPAWELADQIVGRLGGFGDVYVTVLIAGGHFPRLQETDYVAMQRGPMLPGVTDAQVASLGREFMRAVGNPEPEP